METKISGVIITFNEEENIERCIQSLQEVCDEILVVGRHSIVDPCRGEENCDNDDHQKKSDRLPSKKP